MIEKCFKGTPSHVGGIGFLEIARESLARHAKGYAEVPTDKGPTLDDAGHYRFRRAGEKHAVSPPVIQAFHSFVKTASPDDYARADALVPSENGERFLPVPGVLDDDRVTDALAPLANLACRRDDPEGASSDPNALDALNAPLASYSSAAQQVTQGPLVAAAVAPIEPPGPPPISLNVASIGATVWPLVTHQAAPRHTRRPPSVTMKDGIAR